MSRRGPGRRLLRWRARGPVMALALLGSACSGSTAPSIPATAAPSPPGTSTPAPPPPGTGMASPSPSASPTASPQAAPVAWLTYHGDPARTGVDVSSPPLGAPSPAWRSPVLDGPVWAEPLVDGNRLLVATDGGSVYSLDAATGAVIWRTHVADPIPRANLPCGDVSPLGITGTPVVDPATGTLFAVAETSSYSHVLVALSVTSGAVQWRRTIDPAGTVPRDQQQRAALALAGGRVVVAMGGLDGDCGTYRGYVVSVAESGTGPVNTYILPVINEGGIWAPSGPAVDPAGQIFVASGNSRTGASFDHSNSVIALTPSLSEVGYFAPTDWRYLSNADLDLGSTGPLLDAGDILVAGKDGVLYLLSAQHLGGIGGELARLPLGSGAFGGLALDGSTVLVPTTARLDAVSVDIQGSALRLRWSGPATWPPIVAGGVIWAVTRSGARLVALSPASGSQIFSLALGSVEHFTTPAAGGGRVFVAAGNRIVAVQGV